MRCSSATATRDAAPPRRQLAATVLMPVRNEETDIAEALRAVLAQDLPDGALEVLVLDGRSTDATVDVVRRVASDARFAVRVLVNDGESAAAGLALGLREATTDVVVRVDGHCVVPPDYVRRLLDVLDDEHVVAAGGSVQPVGRGRVGEGIARAQCSRLATGGAAFRHPGDGSPRDVDTVPFPAYRRDAVLAAGGFDVALVRNQDDALHAHLRRAGGRIVLVPDLVVRYAVRDSFRALARQYFGYGHWKVLAWRRGAGLTSWRALAPAALVAGIVALGVAAASVFALRAGAADLGASLTVLGTTLLLVVVPAVLTLLYEVAARIAYAFVTPGLSPLARLVAPLSAAVEGRAITVMHLAYGVGFWWGVLRASTVARSGARPSA